MTEGGWLNIWEGGCHEKGRRGVGWIEGSETAKMFKSEPNMELILYQKFGDISCCNISECSVRYGS